MEGAPDDLHRLLAQPDRERAAPHPGDATVRASVRVIDGAVQLEVSDDGLGIVPQRRDRVFDRFSRGGSDATPAFSGSGLGLSIVRAVADAHGGTVTLDDAPRRRRPLHGAPA